MSPSTTPHGYPYPLGTDRLTDGDESIRDLALAVDGRLGVIAGGTVNVPIVAAGNAVTVAVTYPAGRFTALPSLSVTPLSTAPGSVRSSVRDPLATGFTLVGSRDSGTNAFPVQWIAVQAP